MGVSVPAPQDFPAGQSKHVVDPAVLYFPATHVYSTQNTILINVIHLVTICVHLGYPHVVYKKNMPMLCIYMLRMSIFCVHLEYLSAVNTKDTYIFYTLSISTRVYTKV